jgi:hypothetical protein
LFIGYVLVVSWFLMAIVLATIYTVYKSGLKVRAGRGRCVGVVSCNVTAHDGVGCAQGEVAQVLYHQHQRLAAAWQLFGCHVSGKLSWSVWEQLFAVLKPHYRPEKVPTFTAHTLIVLLNRVPARAMAHRRSSNRFA